MYDFILVFLMFSSNIWLNSVSLRDTFISPQDLSEPDFDLLRSIWVKSNGAVGLHIDKFLLVFNHVNGNMHNIWARTLLFYDM